MHHFLHFKSPVSCVCVSLGVVIQPVQVGNTLLTSSLYSKQQCVQQSLLINKGPVLSVEADLRQFRLGLSWLASLSNGVSTSSSKDD